MNLRVPCAPTTQNSRDEFADSPHRRFCSQPCHCGSTCISHPQVLGRLCMHWGLHGLDRPWHKPSGRLCRVRGTERRNYQQMGLLVITRGCESGVQSLQQASGRICSSYQGLVTLCHLRWKTVTMLSGALESLGGGCAD